MTSTSKRGFASMDAKRQRQIASMGGRAAHQRGSAHTFDSEEARRAGRIGGESVSRDRRHMAEIGARGGHASRGGKERNAGQQDKQDQDTDAVSTVSPEPERDQEGQQAP
jgi:general stress protein YciG